MLSPTACMRRTWTCPALQTLFDRYIPGWREDNFSLRYALSIPQTEVWAGAHGRPSGSSLQHVTATPTWGWTCEVLTLGFARRATAYKRADLLFQDVERLQRSGRDRPVHSR